MFKWKNMVFNWVSLIQRLCKKIKIKHDFCELVNQNIYNMPKIICELCCLKIHVQIGTNFYNKIQFLMEKDH